MCTIKASKVSAARVAAYDNTQATRSADIEARLRRRRSAAANVLTSPTGIPSVKRMGEVA